MTLCLGHHLGTPGLSWDAMLKMTRFELELISDPDMYIFFAKSRWGGISYISNRYSKTNNKCSKSYHPKQKSKHVIYLGTNNLYGFVLPKFLPTSGLKWIDRKTFDLNKYATYSSKDCVLEGDLEYPKELCNLHNDYALAPGKIKIKSEIISEYQVKDDHLCKISMGNVEKIVPNFFDEEKGVL